MTAQTWLDRLRAEGFGVTMNAWAEEADVAVMLWRDGEPVAAGSGPALAVALAKANEALGRLHG